MAESGLTLKDGVSLSSVIRLAAGVGECLGLAVWHPTLFSGHSLSDRHGVRREVNDVDFCRDGGGLGLGLGETKLWRLGLGLRDI